MHHHYLKGSLFCGHCHSAGLTQRMIIQHTVNRHSIEYRYFFCRGKQSRACPTRYISVVDAETAVERHYATLELAARQLDTLRDRLATFAEADDRPDLRRSRNALEIYRRCGDEQRRLLNQTIFRRLYIAGDRVTSHDLNPANDWQSRSPEISDKTGTP